jgi:hypothetical protein
MKDASQATKSLLDFVLAKLGTSMNLFHDENEESYCEIVHEGRKHYMFLNSDEFRLWLSHEYYVGNGFLPPSKDLNSTIGFLSHKAKKECPERKVWKRVGRSMKKKAIYLDLQRSDGLVVKITRNGWNKVRSPKVVFHGSNTSRPLPIPVDVDNNFDIFKILKRYFNCTSQDKLLLLTWIIGTLNPDGPFPILVLQGEAGSGKSTVAELLKNIIDPSVGPLRTLHESERDLMIACKNNWVLVFDNISRISERTSNALCRIATRGGLSTRQLYTDAEEVVFDMRRPLILNGIANIISKNDLADRAIIVELKKLSDKRRRTVEELFDSFRKDHPRILGAICNAVVMALKNKGKIQLNGHVRMADFHEWVAAAEPAMTRVKGRLLKAIIKNRRNMSRSSVENDVLGAALQDFLKKHDGIWKGTHKDLLNQLVSESGDKDSEQRMLKDEQWPKGPNKLSARLKELAPALRNLGIEYSHVMNRGRKLLTITMKKRRSRKK